MRDLVVITPTRGRPRQFVELLEAIDRTAELETRVLAARDHDDRTDYATARGGREFACKPTLYRGPRRSLSGWTNHLALKALESPDPPRFLASLGDDHRPRTPGWDRLLVGAIEGLGGSGIAYGNDLLQGKRVPTAWVVSADIVRALGWMMLPTCEHMYVDNATLELGRALDRIAYVPEVVIEHVHPVAGKAPWDESYRESNATERYAADGDAFEAWRVEQLAADAKTVRRALEAQREPAPAGSGGGC